MIKKLLVNIFLLLFLENQAQVPQAFKYQGIARNNLGIELVNSPLSVKISIRDLTPTGTILYQEKFSVTTNSFGLFNIDIGQGTVGSGTFSAINWGSGNKFIEQEIDFGSGYQNVGTSQLLSVPYALYAGSSGSSNGWSTTGNAGTNDTVNFIGTTDNKPLNFRVNNQKAGRIDFSGNTFFGLRSGSSVTTGISNTAVGFNSLFSNTTGFQNTANGMYALYSNSTGFQNTANGMYSLYSNTSGNNNTANGYVALYLNTTGYYNTAAGFYALRANTTGNNNTAHGVEALLYNTTGSNNTSNGSFSLYNNITGNSNVAVGHFSLYKNTKGSNLVAIGDSALFNNGIGVSNYYEGTGNTAVGSKALFSNTNGFYNTALGNRALYSNTTGFHNIGIGYEALPVNTTGNYNNAIGVMALESNTTGGENIAMGSFALKNNYNGWANTAVGLSALMFNTTGNCNTAFGRAAMFYNTSGIQNTACGWQSLGSNQTGSRNTALGFAAFFTNINYSNSAAVGYCTPISANNQIRLGDPSITSIGGFCSWTNISDARFKKNITENVPGIDFIKKLRPVTYNLDMDQIAAFLKTPDSLRLKESEISKGNMLQSGFIAQEVEKAAKELGFDFSGIDKPKNADDHYGLRYAEFVVPLVKAMQEQQAIIEILRNENAALSKRISSLEQNQSTLKKLSKK